MDGMDDRQLGRRVRAVRQQLGLRQVDVAVMAEVSRYAVLRIERGGLAGLSVASLRAVARALEMEIELVARWHGGELDRLIDEGHAALAGIVSARLVALGWEVRAEVSFSVYGERGSIDLLAWHAPTRTLLVIEIKASLNSIEETLRRLDVKVRLAPQIAASGSGGMPPRPHRSWRCRTRPPRGGASCATMRSLVGRFRFEARMPGNGCGRLADRPAC